MREREVGRMLERRRMMEKNEGWRGRREREREEERDLSLESSDSLGSATGGFMSAKTRSVPCFSL